MSDIDVLAQKIAANLHPNELLSASRWDECDGEPMNDAAIELMKRWGE